MTESNENGLLQSDDPNELVIHICRKNPNLEEGRSNGEELEATSCFAELLNGVNIIAGRES
jgi:hypothetical protein